MLVEHLDEAAHVRALEIVGKIYKKVDIRRGALRFVILVENLHGIADIFNADLLQGNGSRVGGGLDVYHFLEMILDFGEKEKAGGGKGINFIRSSTIKKERRRNAALVRTQNSVPSNLLLV